LTRDAPALGRIYPLAVFLSAFLLFQVQFIAAKRLLPWFGGAPAVWTTCMLFFQVLLLGGYAYAHLTGRLGPRRQRAFHVALVTLSVLVLAGRLAVGAPAILPGPDARPADPGSPVRHILALLLASVGLPYFVLAATGPLLQSWRAGSRPGESPYRLYAWSNLGSLLGLVAYPFLVEPLLSLRGQAAAWAAAYGLFAAAVAGAAVLQPRRDIGAGPVAAETAHRPASPSASLRALWFSLAAGPSVLLLAVTNQMCQEVAVVPLLWMLPLALYLVTLVVTFESDRAYHRGFWSAAFAGSAAAACAVVARGPSAGVPLQVAVLAAVLLAGGMACHGELSRLKPAAAALTSFYLAVAAGGAAGGVFVALVAPRVFRAYWEFPLGVVACAVLVWIALAHDKTSPFYRGPAGGAAVALGLALLSSALALPEGKARPIGVVACIAAVLLMAAAARAVPAGLMARGCLALAWVLIGSQLAGQALASVVNARWVDRNFYGVLRVDERTADRSGQRYLALKHGQITHGVQYRDAALRREPTAYFGRDSGIGRVLRALRDRATGGPLRVAVVGLGVGTLAAYAEPGDDLRFYEINPAVIEVAGRGAGFFGYLSDTRAALQIIPGDARLSLEREASAGRGHALDLLAVDAFNSDAIPVHLLTREAVGVYLRHLAPNGVLALHLSNRFLDLRPVALSLARDRGLAWTSVSTVPTAELEFPSVWGVLSRDPALLDAPVLRDVSERGGATAPGPLWTDDHSDLLRALRR